MKKILKLTLSILLIAFILFQFYPRPSKNIADGINANDITMVHFVPADVLNVIKTSCYDCHSNNTYYPWYAKLQPVALWLGEHVKDGKDELNFSEFGSYNLRRQYRKLEKIKSEVIEDEMPLSSYTLIHRDAIINQDKKALISGWVDGLRDSFKLNFPADSLNRKK